MPWQRCPAAGGGAHQPTVLRDASPRTCGSGMLRRPPSAAPRAVRCKQLQPARASGRAQVVVIRVPPLARRGSGAQATARGEARTLARRASRRRASLHEQRAGRAGRGRRRRQPAGQDDPWPSGWSRLHAAPSPREKAGTASEGRADGILLPTWRRWSPRQARRPVDRRRNFIYKVLKPRSRWRRHPRRRPGRSSCGLPAANRRAKIR